MIRWVVVATRSRNHAGECNCGAIRTSDAILPAYPRIFAMFSVVDESTMGLTCIYASVRIAAVVVWNRCKSHCCTRFGGLIDENIVKIHKNHCKFIAKDFHV